MADEAISTAIMTVATIIAALVLVNAMYPALYGASGSILSMNDRSADRLRTEIKVLTEWYPGGQPADLALEVWLKNTGSASIAAADMASADAFLFTGGGIAELIPRDGPGNRWAYRIMNDNGDGNWDAGETIQVHVAYDAAGLDPGPMRFRLVLPNGVSAEDRFAYA